jgi:putative membrane protein
VIDTLNDGEVEVAYAALPKLTITAVVNYAQEMVTAHSTARQNNLQLAQSLGVSPAPSPLQGELKAMADAQVATFQSSPAASLDVPYVDSQVAMHGDALALANQLLDAADSAELRAELMTLRTAITAHLAAAQALQASLP